MTAIDLKISTKQREFISATEDEVLYGGAAGGGKSYGQLIDALLFALKYPKSKQLIFRRTFAELDNSLIRVSRDLFPGAIAGYNGSKYSYTFVNGSIIDFGYMSTEDTVHRYQSSEYDIIRFDELTHFTETMYTYMLSRIRGANPYPKQMKSSTNPGGIGHGWVRKRFIDLAPPNTTITTPTGTRKFIPAKVQDNNFLMKADPEYITRLNNLPEEERKALLYGSWDVFSGQYFTEWDRAKHVIEPFTIPKEWRRFRSMDWGYNDPCAVLWYAVGPDGRVYVYREATFEQTLSRDVADRVRELSEGESIAYTVISPDAWQHRGLTDIAGESIADTFTSRGVPVIKADNSRVIGWNRCREFLADMPDGLPGVQIFSGCLKLIETLPQMIYDEKNVEDVADGLPDHWSESFRYGLMSRPRPARAKIIVPPKPYNPLDEPKRRRDNFAF